MTKPDKHSRRDFLRGRAAVRVVASQAQAWVDTASELLGANLPAGPAVHVTASRRAMACEFAVQYHDADDDLHEEVLAAFDLIERIEDRLTIYRDHNEVMDINRQAGEGPVEIDSELFALLQRCQRLHRDTAGAFDITSGPLSRAWGFLQRAGQLPNESEIAAALALVGCEKVVLDAKHQTVRFLEPGMEINFNSIGKGYALDRAAALLDETEQSDYLWHGGGSSVLARGENRNSRNRCWTIGLRNPLQPERRLAEFHLRDRALATAGGATQFFVHEGQQFSHILDPRTGWPAAGVLTASVLAPTAALADGLATAFFVMGIEATEAYCSQHPEIGAVLVCPSEKPSGFTLNSFGLAKEDWTRSPEADGC